MKASKVCCARRQVIPYVDDSIAKKVNFSIIRTTLFIYDIFVTAQVWLISSGEKLITIEAHHAKHNSVHQQHARTKSSYL